MSRQVAVTLVSLLAGGIAWAETTAAAIRPALVQSGPGTIPPFYATSRLEPGQTVVVLAEEGEFYAIQPPPGSFSYVPSAAIRLVPGEKSVGVVHEAVTTLVGSQLNAECSTQGVRLSPGTLVRILGQERIRVGQQELHAYRIEPVGEKRYIVKSAIAQPATVQRQATANHENVMPTVLDSRDSFNPGELNLVRLRQLADQAYQRGCQTGDFGEAKRLYRELSAAADPQVRWEAMNRLEFIRLREQEWAAKNAPSQHLQPTTYRPGPGFPSAPEQPLSAKGADSWRPPGKGDSGVDSSYRVCGVLRRSAFYERGQPLYFLEDHLGRLRCYVFGQDSEKWQAWLGRSVEVYGTPPVYRGDLRAEIVTATCIRPLP